METIFIDDGQRSRALQRNQAFWKGGLEEGPLMWVTAPGARPSWSVPEPATEEEAVEDRGGDAPGVVEGMVGLQARAHPPLQADGVAKARHHLALPRRQDQVLVAGGWKTIQVQTNPPAWTSIFRSATID